MCLQLLLNQFNVTSLNQIIIKKTKLTDPRLLNEGVCNIILLILMIF